MPWSYDKATDTLTVWGGTPEAPITLDDFDGELDISSDPIVILPETVVPLYDDLTTGPANQPVVGGNLGALIHARRTAGDPPFMTPVVLTGKDAWGGGATPTRYAGDMGNWTSFGRLSWLHGSYGIYADNDSPHPWTLTVAQRSVQRITRAAAGMYVVHSNLLIGNGTDATHLASIGERVRFDPDRSYDVQANAALEVAALPGETWVGWEPPHATATARRGMIYIGPWQ